MSKPNNCKSLALGSMNILTVPTDILLFSFFWQTYCKLLWIKASAKCPNVKNVKNDQKQHRHTLYVIIYNNIVQIMHHISFGYLTVWVWVCEVRRCDGRWVSVSERFSPFPPEVLGTAHWQDNHFSHCTHFLRNHKRFPLGIWSTGTTTIVHLKWFGIPCVWTSLTVL